MFFHALGNFDLYFPLRRSFAYFLNVVSRSWQFLPLRWSVVYSLNVTSCPRQFQFSFSASAVICVFSECCFMPLAISLASVVSHIFLECSFMPSVISIYISRSSDHSHIS